MEFRSQGGIKLRSLPRQPYERPVSRSTARFRSCMVQPAIVSRNSLSRTRSVASTMLTSANVDMVLRLWR